PHLSNSALPHPAHPSLPTRRSSDLVSGLNEKAAQPAQGSERLSAARSARSARLSLGLDRRRRRIASSWRRTRISNSSAMSWRSRSEEHTSELQSRFDLVCRLLLEKK